jgi:hypothetical protein
MATRVVNVTILAAIAALLCVSVFAQAPAAPAKPVAAAPAAPAAAAKPAAAAPAAPAASGDLVPLKLDLPKPMFVGTPKSTPSKNLDPKTGTKRDPLMVPKDVVPISKGKPASASDKEPVIGEMPMITDADKEAQDGSYIEFGPGTQWVQVDLQGEFEIFAILVWHYHSQARIYHDFIVQISDDKDFVKDVKTVYNNDDDNSSKLGVGKDYEYIETNEGRLVDAKATKGRYVRCYSRGNTSNDMNHMTEIEVFGRPAK